MGVCTKIWRYFRSRKSADSEDRYGNFRTDEVNPYEQRLRDDNNRRGDPVYADKCGRIRVLIKQDRDSDRSKSDIFGECIYGKHSRWACRGCKWLERCKGEAV